MSNAPKPTPQGHSQGHCLCGAVRVNVARGVGEIGVCHCDMCKHWSGGVFACFHAKSEEVEVTGQVATYESSPVSERAFCPKCGSHLWMRDYADDGYDLMPGLFAMSARDWPLISEIYCDQRLEAFRLKGTHKKATAAEYEAKNPSPIGEKP